MVRVKNIYLEKDLSVLELDKNILKKLIDADIKIVSDLWVLNRTKLKELGIKDSDIKTITIKMQLLGLDLNKKVYN